jgi:hypothetical protein
MATDKALEDPSSGSDVLVGFVAALGAPLVMSIGLLLWEKYWIGSAVRPSARSLNASACVSHDVCNRQSMLCVINFNLQAMVSFHCSLSRGKAWLKLLHTNKHMHTHTRNTHIRSKLHAL